MKNYLLAVAISTLSISSAWAGGIMGFGMPSDAMSNSSFYAGASMGTALGDLKDVCDKADISCKNWKVYGGYKFNQNFGAEAGYYNILDASKNGIDLQTTGIGLMGTVTMPVGQTGAEVFGKLGAIHGKSEVTTTDDKGNTISVSDSGTNLLVGVGAGYKFNQNWGVRGEVEAIKGDEGEGNIGLVSGGVTFSTF